jgi:hypothetical protein
VIAPSDPADFRSREAPPTLAADSTTEDDDQGQAPGDNSAADLDDQDQDDEDWEHVLVEELKGLREEEERIERQAEEEIQIVLEALGTTNLDWSTRPSRPTPRTPSPPVRSPSCPAPRASRSRFRTARPPRSRTSPRAGSATTTRSTCRIAPS